MAQRERAQLHAAAVRRMHQPAEDRRLVGQVLGELAEHVDDIAGCRQRMGEQATEDDVERVGLELDRRRHPEVSAAAAQRPEQVRLVLAVDDAHLTVSGHHLDLRHVVDR